jgi:phosphoribosyl 1,2-cyclic phosphodiesterase
VRSASPEPLPVHAPLFHQRRIREIFPHLLREGRERIALRPWEDGTSLAIGGATLVGFETGHRAEFPTIGVLVVADGRRVAWATDMGEPPASTTERLAGVDLFVGDATYLGGPGHGHPGTDAVLAFARRIEAKRVALTHVGHVGVPEAEMSARVGADVRLLRDGERLPVAHG